MDMSKERHIIYVPGLRDQHLFNKSLARLYPLVWKPQGFHFHTISPHWEEGISFTPKLKMITNKIDELSVGANHIYLLGVSAGGSAVLNAFSQRRDLISGVVNVVGRLRAGVNVKPSLDKATKISPACRESILSFENQNEPTLSEVDRRKVMTLRPVWDETVPKSTVSLKGAKNIVVPMVEHSLGGIAIMTIFSPMIVKFFKGLD